MSIVVNSPLSTIWMADHWNVIFCSSLASSGFSSWSGQQFACSFLFFLSSTIQRHEVGVSAFVFVHTSAQWWTADLSGSTALLAWMDGWIKLFCFASELCWCPLMFIFYFFMVACFIYVLFEFFYHLTQIKCAKGHKVLVCFTKMNQSYWLNHIFSLVFVFCFSPFW